MPLDPVTAALMGDFSKQNALDDISIEDQFEHFINYIVIQNRGFDYDDIADIHAGKPEFGLDGIGIFLNNRIILDNEEFIDANSTSKVNEVDFVFIQSKTETGIDAGNLSKTFGAVSDFFSDKINLVQSQRIKDLHKVKESIFESAAKLSRGLPSLYVYYAYPGRWAGDRNLSAIIDANKQQLREKNIFGDIEFIVFDADRIQRSYYSTKNAISRDVNIPRNVAIPQIPDVSEAYIGVVDSIELVKILQTETGESIQKSIFADNVRDELGGTAVNKSITETIRSDRSLEFPLRNNGITVVCRDLKRIGDKFVLTDYQIVNGCQTCHVIFSNKDCLKPGMFVPIKVVATSNDDVMIDIIKGSNRQNEVSQTQFWALEPFHKKIEIYFSSMEGDRKIFYERRRGQFAGASNIEKVRVINPENLLKAFSAMIIDEPHQVSKYFTGLIPMVGHRIFADKHKLYLYYAAAYALYRVEQLFRNSYLPKNYRVYRYQMLMALKYVTIRRANVDIEGKKSEGQANEIIRLVSDPSKSVESFLLIIAKIQELEIEDGIQDKKVYAKSAALRNKLRERVLAELVAAP